MTTDVLLYTTNWCPFCRRAKALLKEKGVRWKELDIEADPAHRQAMAEASGRSSVPQIFINGTLIGGSDELFALDVRGELDKLRAQPACHLRRCGLGQPAREPSPVDEYKGESVGLSHLERHYYRHKRRNSHRRGKSLLPTVRSRPEPA